MNRNLYIIPAGFQMNCTSYCELFHGIELASGEVLVSMKFTNGYSQREWENLPGVEAVGSDYAPKPISDAHATKLAEHGVKKGHTVGDVRHLLKAKSRLM